METTDRGDVELSPGYEFEVFLNFRGPDTRLNFADCLYHSMDIAGIRVFRDDEEIRKGDAIGGELERAIKSSTICMPIFSRTYASSAWCLRELAYMVDCSGNKDNKAMILPIFYDVDPGDVNLKTALYCDALQKHEQKFGCGVVERWKEALREVACMKGWDLKDSGQGELIRLIVAEVLIKLNERDKNLPDHLVGIQDCVEDVVSLLDEGYLDVRYLVIHGIGGIGKTTLAKVVFNQIASQFHGCSFLLDVREASEGGKVVQLQKQLLSEILNFKPEEISDFDEGINQIKRKFRNKKVLIVLDNLDKWDQLSKLAEKSDWFGLGSRIIITTRDINFLPIEEENRENKVQKRFEEFKIYEMRELYHRHALQLFSKHAFHKDSPPHEYYEISCNIIGKAGRLPLALEVIGSSLYGKSKQHWKDKLRKLYIVPKQDVLDKLKISFEMLGDTQREIFLNIACYFIGEEGIHPHFMWKALDFVPKNEIDILILIRRSLIKIDDDRLFMHDLLRDLGREIAQQNDLKAPGKHGPKIALDVMQTRKSMEKMKDEARQRAADMETSDRNYAIATVQNVVGIGDRVKQITDLPEMEVIDEVRIIGIYGADGIGKTTLAKAVYDRIASCFDSCSFLAEVEETTQYPCGIQFFQTKLIHDILERDCEDPSLDETIELFLDIFCEMKVLIVVDDVEKQSHLHAIVGDQLQWFGLGSRIIVTSQNEEILKEYDPEKARTYMVGKLDDGQAFELFCKHAFRMQSSIPGYGGHANCIVNATEKLPLAIEVIGSFLRGKSTGEWKKMEELQKQFMSSEKTTVCFAEILDICYEALDPKQKHIFLDIACFLSGVDARIASYMWPSSYLPSADSILMPLAKIGENNELQMHRLIRCLGKRILIQEGSGDPIGRKFYIHDMVPNAISREKGMENVEALSFDFTAGDFQSMPNIRFLKLDNAKVSGNFAGAFASLRWLCWQRCPLEFDAFNFVLRELVILDLSWSKVTEDWGGWSEFKIEKLKVLNLTGCSDLLITPNFSHYKDLEIQILERCSRLVKLDPSIGHLKRLVSLNLKFCSQLNGLPVELGCMTALKELFINGTSVRQIPISIGNLKQLEILSGFNCFPSTHLPSSISYLTALSVLSLDGAKISELPSSLGELLNLSRLSLRDCHFMRELPDSIGKMGSSLEELDISATSISKLPDSIKDLQNLRVLRIDSSFIRAFPVEIGNLTKLEELHASWCRSLKGAIPRDIKRLHHLRSLTLGQSSVSSLPSEISSISSLHTLDLLQCNEIEVLPELPPSIICLRASSKRMKGIPLLKDLKELEELCLSDDDPKERQPPPKQLTPESKVKLLSIWFSRLWNLELLQTQRIEKQSFSISFPKLRKLELSLSRIIKLQFVYEPTDIPQLKTLTLSGLSLEEVSGLPKTLSVLSIQGCSSLKRLPIDQCLTNVSAFELYHSAIEEIEGLKSLKRLDISNCKIQNLNGIVQLTSLRSLIVSDCDYLHSLPDLSNLKLLKVLEIRQCKMIHQIEGLQELTSLEKLKISECPAENSVQVQNVSKLVMARSVVM